jgi:hypothetical protein
MDLATARSARTDRIGACPPGSPFSSGDPVWPPSLREASEPGRPMRNMTLPPPQAPEGMPAESAHPAFPPVHELPLSPAGQAPEASIGTPDPGPDPRRKMAPAPEIAERTAPLGWREMHPVMGTPEEESPPPGWQMRPAVRPRREQSPLRPRDFRPGWDCSRVGGRPKRTASDQDKNRCDPDPTSRAGTVSRLS